MPILYESDGTQWIPVTSGSGLIWGPWIYVGTPSQCGDPSATGTTGIQDNLGRYISALILDNPAPFNTTPWVPWQNGWNHSLGDDAPYAFCRSTDLNFLYIGGGYTGGTPFTTIFTLPTGYIPLFRTPLNTPFSDFSDIADYAINPDGTVVDFGGF